MKTQNKANKSSEEKQSFWEKPFFKFCQQGWEKIRNWLATSRLKNILQLFFKPPNAPNKQLLVRSIVLIFFLAWTFLLGSETWAIQQSCSPMIQPLQQSDVKALGDRCKPPCLEPNIVVDGICVSLPPTCSEGQKLVDGICVSLPPTCSEGQKLVDGKCVSPPITCPRGQELVGGKCVCPEGRKLIGNRCVPIDLIGLGAGGVAAGIAAVTAAPVAVVAGVGFAVWWIVRKLAGN